VELAPAGAEWHGIAVKRVAAFLLGLAVLAFALFGTLGAAVLVPFGMLVVGLHARRRGRTITRGQSWLAGVLPFGVIVTVGLMGGVVAGPWRAKYDDLQRSIIAADRKPREQPAFVKELNRALNVPPPAPLGPSVATPLAAYSLLLVVQFWCLMMGTVAWAGTACLVYGLHGPRVASPDSALEAFTRETAR
jgi:hypothetical protein